MKRTLFSAGHSTREGAELVALLVGAGIECLVDVRRFPSSRRHPDFNRPALAGALERAGIAYRWAGEHLGGRRGPVVASEDSRNRALAEPAFRHYADALSLSETRAALEVLASEAATRPHCLLCAERDWRRCHRQILADWFVLQGWQVVHLIDPAREEAHAVSPWARLEQGELVYPTLL